VLYFEGERGHHFRVLRAVKNRFGPTDEIGVFEMTGKGLAEVANPSALFLGDRNSASPGAAVFAGLEGTRPACWWKCRRSSRPGYGTPRRAVVGWDSGRLAMILAVLDARAGPWNERPRCLSERRGRPEDRRAGGRSGGRRGAGFLVLGPRLPKDCVFFGEISLSGDVRPAPQAELRLKEAAKLALRAPCPAGTKSGGPGLTLQNRQGCGRTGRVCRGQAQSEGRSESAW
jgi:DNA repair protein RadA/Sms